MKILNWWYSLKYGIPNLIAYAPLIWKDRDWDSGNLMHLMEFKLRRMVDCFQKHSNHWDSAAQAAAMKECADILYRIRNETHQEEAYKEHYAGWCEVAQQKEAADMARFGELFKGVQSWWD